MKIKKLEQTGKFRKRDRNKKIKGQIDIKIGRQEEKKIDKQEDRKIDSQAF